MTNAQTFFLSDPHFGHQNIIKFSRTQFKTIEEHDQCLMDNWCSVVKSKDTIFLGGDLCMGNRDDGFRKIYALPGMKRLIMGNHDPKIHGQLEAPYWLKLAGIDWAAGCHELRKHGKKILLTHIPVHPCQKDRYDLNIHGHMHNEHVTMEETHYDLTDQGYEVTIKDKFYFNVCAEHINLTPISLEQILETL